MSLSSWDELIRPANPAVGANFNRTVPGHTFEQFLSVEATFVMSAAAANRFPFVAYQDGDLNELYRVPVGAAVIANATVTVTWSQELDTNAPANSLFVGAPLRGEELPSGFHLVVGIAAIDVGDQISAIRMWTRRTPTGPMEYAAGARAFDPVLQPGSW